MARLVGFIGNRPDLGARVIELEGRALDVRRKLGVTPGWGVGFYQGGEILLKRRPLDDRAEIKITDLTRDIRADVLLAQVRLATVGPLRTENTHPFRYRTWLFANTGTVEAFATLRG
ncbi:MAG: class II glutamine amidotransferase, partial [Byssovorax sp.]